MSPAAPVSLRGALIWGARIVVAAVFVAAAIPKLLDPVGFAESIANYRAFPWWSVNLLAGVVPMLELIAAGALMFGPRRPAAIVLGALDVGFIVLIASVLIRGIDVECGCFGRAEPSAAEPPVGLGHLVRDVALLAAIIVAALPTGRPRADPPGSAA